MSYLIILFVIALALAPLSHFVPSKAQRKIVRLREYAAVHGLFVEFRDLPGTVSTAGAKKTPTIYYGKRVKASRQAARPTVAWSFDKDGWISVPRHEPVPDLLADLPDSVLAASADQYSCGIYWLEGGDEPDIDQICAVLADLSVKLYR